MLFAWCAFAAQFALADPLYTFSGITATDTDIPVTLGFTFTANQTVTVTSLGWFDYEGDGFQSSHTVGIFDKKNGNLLTSATLAAGTGDPLSGFFRYQSIAPINLQAGKTYTLAGTTGGPLDAWAQNDQVTGFAVNSMFTVAPNAALFTYGSGFVDPATPFSDYRVYIGPNLETPSPAATVPEPASLWLLALAAGALLLIRKRAAGAR